MMGIGRLPPQKKGIKNGPSVPFFAEVATSELPHPSNPSVPIPSSQKSPRSSHAVNLDESGSVSAIVDAATILNLYREACAAERKSCDSTIVVGENLTHHG